MVYLESEGQGHGVQHSQWFHSIENIKLYKSQTWTFFASCHRFRDIYISKYLTFRSKSGRTTFVSALFDGKYQTSCLTTSVMFAFVQCLPVNLDNWRVWSWIFKSRSRTFRNDPFEGKYHLRRKSYLNIFLKLSPFSRDSHFAIRDYEMSLKILVKVTDYHIRSFAIRWRISACLKIIKGVFVLIVLEILIS